MIVDNWLYLEGGEYYLVGATTPEDKLYRTFDHCELCEDWRQSDWLQGDSRPSIEALYLGA